MTTVGQMRRAQDDPGSHTVQVSCDTCGEWRPVDLDALIAKEGPDFSLINRRARCKLTAGCKGWNRFHFQGGVMRPLWTEKRANEWCDLEWQNRQRTLDARRMAIELLRGDYVRLDPAPIGIDPQAWALADDKERKLLLRRARG